jgi:hypothetical protein
MAPPESTEARPAGPKTRVPSLVSEYGPLALGVYLVIFRTPIAGFAFAIRSGFQVDGAAATAGTWGAAYVATKLTQPIRIGATLALTPLVARVLRRKGREPRATENV